MKIKFLVLFLCSFYCTFNISAQQQAPQFNWYLHTDKYSYQPGETIFFKVYSLPFSGAAATSIIINLLNDQYRVTASKMLLLQNGTAGAYFDIPISDSSRFFVLQYYPAGSKNEAAGTAVLYRKANCEEQIFPATADTTVSFFPEAGKLVNTLSNRFVFKTPAYPGANSQGVTGKITDELNDSIAPFETAFSNVGRTEIPMEAGKKYYAVFSALGKSFRQQLPAVKETDYTLLNLYPVKNAVVYRVRTTRSEKFVLEISNNHTVYYKASFDLKPQEDMAKTLPDSFIQRGNNFFQLKNSKGVVLNERVYYKYTEVVFEPIVSDTIINKTVSIQFRHTITSPLSISIVNTSTTSDLPGTSGPTDLNTVKKRLEKQYGAQDDQLKEWVDMIAQTSNAKQIVQQEPADNIELVISEREDNKLLKNFNLLVFVKTSDSSRKVLQLTTDANARLYIDRSLIKDSAVIYCYQPGNSNPKYFLAITLVDRPVAFAQPQKILLPGCGAVDKDTSDPVGNTIRLYNQEQAAKTLQEITIKTVKKTPKELLEDQFATGMYQSKVHQLIDFDMVNENQNQMMGSISIFLNNRIPKLDYNYFVNEDLVDKSIANNIPLSEIAYISVMGRNFTPVTGQMGPAVLIYTKKATSGSTAYSLNHSKITVSGYASDSVYFNHLFDDHVIDKKYRGTLYWKSDALMDSTNSIQCPLLFTPDKPIQINITGYDDNGNFISFTKTIQPVYQ